MSASLSLLSTVVVSTLSPHHRGTTRLKFHLTPSTADDKEQQYVYLDLCLCLPALYPQSPPTLSLLQSRGLADAHLTKLDNLPRLPPFVLYTVEPLIMDTLKIGQPPYNGHTGHPLPIYCSYISTSEEGTTSEQWTKCLSPTCPLFGGSTVHHCFLYVQSA